MGHDVAIELLDRLVESAGFELVHTPQDEFDAGRTHFRQYGNLAFGDATMVAYMERIGLDYLYSIDTDFDAVDGITRVDTPTDPFG